jgi:hypothetical protein
VFALFIGTSAAAIRIRREEKEAGRGDVMETLKRRVRTYWGA